MQFLYILIKLLKDNLVENIDVKNLYDGIKKNIDGLNKN